MNMKKILTTLLALMTVLTLASCTANEASSDVPVIGVSQYGEHPSLDNCYEGFKQGLAEAGLTEGEDYKLEFQNAGFDDNIAGQIAKGYVATDVDVICAIATPCATAAYAATEEKDIPIVFNAITDPEAAGLTGGNITGVSDKLPISAQLELIRALQPDAKTIGILYTTSEPNSVSAIAEYKELAPEYGFEIEALGVTAQAEVVQAADTLISKKVDCFSNLTDNNVVGVLGSILEKTNEAGIPVYGSEIEQVKIGCVASAGIEYISLGKKAGALAARILAGEKASDIPYETVTDFETYINPTALSEMNIEVPEAVLDKAITAE